MNRPSFDETQPASDVDQYKKTVEIKPDLNDDEDKRNTKKHEVDPAVIEWFGRGESGGESFEGPIKVDGRDFQIKKKLGEGAMGDAYLVHELKMEDEETGEKFFGPEVVIKIIKPHLLSSQESIERFEREISKQHDMGQIEDYVVSVMDKVEVSLPGSSEKTVGLVLQYMKDGDLDSFAKEIEREGSVEKLKDIEAFISNVAIQICRAVGAFHENGLIHRDIKPKNIFIDKKANTMKLGDFGLVQALEESKQGSNSMYGTVDYMPPEGFSTETTPSEVFDLYAVGGVLYNLRTGKPPIYLSSKGDNWLMRAYNKAHHDVPTIREQLGKNYSPSFLDNVIMTLLKRDPEDRKSVVIDDETYSLETAQDISDTITTLAKKHDISLSHLGPLVKQN